MTGYEKAIEFPCHPTNQLGPPCWPKGWVLHTPEEEADGYPATPHWFAQDHGDPSKAGSTHYFVSFTGDVYQCVDEHSAPIANGVLGKPYPSWADSGISLNRQTLSVEIEGYADSIGDTLIVGSVQWNALVDLIRDRAAAYGIPLDREHVIGHYEVANNRSDPGAGFPWDALIAELQEDEMTERVWCAERFQTWIVGKGGAAPVLTPEDDHVYEAIYGPHSRVMTGAELDALVPR